MRQARGKGKKFRDIQQKEKMKENGAFGLEQDQFEEVSKQLLKQEETTS